MGEEKISKLGNAMGTLVLDLNDIHETGLYINELDNKINKSIALVHENKLDMFPNLEELRIELWIKYTEKNIEKVEKFIKDLSLRLVRVGDYKKKINEIRRKFNSIKTETQDYKISINAQDLPPIIALFNETTEIWNDLTDKEEDLRREAWINFLSKIYLPFVTVSLGIYWAILHFILQWNKDNLNNILFWGALIVVGLYFILIKLAKNPFKIEEE